MDVKRTPPQSKSNQIQTEKKTWIEPAIIYERMLEVRADGPPDSSPFHFLGPLNTSAGLGGGGTCT